MKKENRKKAVSVIVPLLVALLSITLLTRIATSQAIHDTSLKTLQAKQTTVLELTAASTAASAAVTLLPGDTATPIAEKLADLSSHFMVVLCAIFLEKYLLTITGYAAFRILIPAACLCYILSVCLKRNLLVQLCKKLTIFAIAIVLAIPASVGISNMIETTYETTIQTTIANAKDAAASVSSEDQSETEEEDSGFWDGLLSKVTDGVSGVASKAVEKMSGILNGFIEALAVMIVTSCVIPILVMLFFLWLVRIVVGIDLPADGRKMYYGVKGKFHRKTKTPV